MIWAIVIMSVILAALSICAASTEKGRFELGLLVGVLASVDAWLITELKEPNRPEAIDVYRGCTTMEITYEDSVAVDTVVVFNDEY